MLCQRLHRASLLAALAPSPASPAPSAQFSGNFDSTCTRRSCVRAAPLHICPPDNVPSWLQSGSTMQAHASGTCTMMEQATGKAASAGAERLGRHLCSFVRRSVRVQEAAAQKPREPATPRGPAGGPAAGRRERCAGRPRGCPVRRPGPAVPPQHGCPAPAPRLQGAPSSQAGRGVSLFLGLGLPCYVGNAMPVAASVHSPDKAVDVQAASLYTTTPAAALNAIKQFESTALKIFQAHMCAPALLCLTAELLASCRGRLLHHCGGCTLQMLYNQRQLTEHSFLTALL